MNERDRVIETERDRLRETERDRVRYNRVRETERQS